MYFQASSVPRITLKKKYNSNERTPRHISSTRHITIGRMCGKSPWRLCVKRQKSVSRGLPQGARPVPELVRCEHRPWWVRGMLIDYPVWVTNAMPAGLWTSVWPSAGYLDSRWYHDESYCATYGWLDFSFLLSVSCQLPYGVLPFSLFFFHFMGYIYVAPILEI